MCYFVERGIIRFFFLSLENLKRKFGFFFMERGESFLKSLKTKRLGFG